MSAPRRRRIAGETKPGEASGAAAPPTRRPVPPRRPATTSESAKPEPAEATTATPAKPKPKKPEVKKPEPKKPEAAKQGATVSRPARPTSKAKSDKATSDKVSTGTQKHDEPTATETAGSATGGSRARLVAAALVIAIGIAAAAAGFVHMRANLPLSYDQSRAAADAASNAVTKVMSYDYRDLDAYETSIEGLLTDNYMTSELEPSLEVLREEVPAASAQVKATVHSAATVACTGECPNDEATVLVVIDKVTLTANLQAPTVTPQRLSVSMVEVDGRWLVDEMRYIGA